MRPIRHFVPMLVLPQRRVPHAPTVNWRHDHPIPPRAGERIVAVDEIIHRAVEVPRLRGGVEAGGRPAESAQSDSDRVCDASGLFVEERRVPWVRSDARSPAVSGGSITLNARTICLKTSGRWWPGRWRARAGPSNGLTKGATPGECRINPDRDSIGCCPCREASRPNPTNAGGREQFLDGANGERTVQVCESSDRPNSGRRDDAAVWYGSCYTGKCSNRPHCRDVSGVTRDENRFSQLNESDNTQSRTGMPLCGRHFRE